MIWGFQSSMVVLALVAAILMVFSIPWSKRYGPLDVIVLSICFYKIPTAFLHENKLVLVDSMLFLLSSLLILQVTKPFLTSGIPIDILTN